MSKTKNKTEKNESKNVKIKTEVFKVNKTSIDDLELKEGMDVVLEKWTFRKLLRGVEKGKIIVDHDFQRDEVFKTMQKSGVINSAMLGKCIPPLYAFEERKADGTYVLSIIDGQQRLASIRGFMNNEYALKIPYGELSILNNYTYDQISKINKELAEQIGDLTIDINVIRNISKTEAQEYFGLINTTSTPLSPGEKLWSLHDPVKTILKEIVTNKHFKITNLRKTRKREYVIATKLLWNEMFNDPIKHEFVGETIQEFLNYFNSVDDEVPMMEAQKRVINLLKIYSEITSNAQYSPKTYGDLYSTLSFLTVIREKNKINTTKLSKFINWVFKGINKQRYPVSLKKQFDILLGNRVGTRGRTNCKDFVITLENLYFEEEAVWK